MSSDLAQPDTEQPAPEPAPRLAGPAPAKTAKSPGLALVLSLFPGLGQVYNGQPAKALVFFFGWAGSIYLSAEGNPMPFALLIPFVYFYNMVDAYRSAVLANARNAGTAEEEGVAESPAWGASLVALGLLLLANNLGWLNLAALQRYWPLLLIVAGGIFVYGSVQKQKE
jgi:TM2 domain-containing membrane protein YozV